MDDKKKNTADEDDIFLEMEPYTVNVGDFDDSREAIYSDDEEMEK